MKNLHKNVFGIYWIACFCLGAGCTLLLVCIVPGVQRRRGIARFGARFIFWATGMSPQLHQAELLPDTTAIVVANHASYLDGILMTAALPSRFAFVIKKEVTTVPIVHFLLRRIGSHFVNRTDAKQGALDARQILRSANAKVSLGFFPEGTFRLEPGLGHFKPGAFRIAARSNLPVIPAVIQGSRQVLPDKRFLPWPGKLTVTLTKAIRSDDAGHLSAQSRRQILALLDEPDLS